MGLVWLVPSGFWIAVRLDLCKNTAFHLNKHKLHFATTSKKCEEPVFHEFGTQISSADVLEIRSSRAYFQDKVCAAKNIPVF
ncbi:hypothetical protein RQN30_02885 [Arcanobacterium hippocoleae]